VPKAVLRNSTLEGDVPGVVVTGRYINTSAYDLSCSGKFRKNYRGQTTWKPLFPPSIRIDGRLPARRNFFPRRRIVLQCATGDGLKAARSVISSCEFACLLACHFSNMPG